MEVVAMQFDLHIPASHSLKEKRSAIRPIVDGLRSRFKVPVAESGYLDQWQRAEIGVAIAGSSVEQVQKTMNNVERFVSNAPEAEVLSQHVSWLEVNE